MAENTAISWADHTFNAWIGCQKVGPPCENCYAEAWARWFRPEIEWGPHGARVMTSDAAWAQPLKWNRQAEAAGVPAVVFGGSLMDWADKRAPAGARPRYGQLIGKTPWLRWILLTKRAGNVAAAIEEMGGWQPNIWAGLTVGGQEDADRDLPVFLEATRGAALRMVSYGPALDPLDMAWAHSRNPFEIGAGFLKRGHFSPGLETLRRIDFVAAEGESGPGARPAHPDWFRKVRDDCAAAGVPFDFKQWGEWSPVYPEASGFDGRIVTLETPGPDWDGCMWRVGKKAAGCLLDGVEHHARPVLE